MDRKYRIWAELGRYLPEGVRDEDELPYHIEGVRDRYIEVLVENGYKTLEDVKEASLEELIELDGIGEVLATRILSEV